MVPTDEEKRKYFRVQANHYAVAPANAKYTKASVEQERRDVKVRITLFFLAHFRCIIETERAK